MTLLGLVARIGVTGSTCKCPFRSRISVCIGVAALFSTGAEFAAGVGRCYFCASGIGVRCARFLLIVQVGVSTSYDRGVVAAFTTFPERLRSFTKTLVSGPIGDRGLALCLLLNMVSCFNLLWLSHACSLPKSGQCGFSWVSNIGTLFLICLPISNWAGENLHAGGVDW